jgi:hypothetical protein
MTTDEGISPLANANGITKLEKDRRCLIAKERASTPAVPARGAVSAACRAILAGPDG